MRINFDIQATEPYNGHTPTYPPGEYAVEVVDELADQQLRNGDGTALVLVYQILDGEFQGQRIRDWLLLGHEGVNVKELAQRKLKAICAAVGTPVISDTRELFHRPFALTLSYREWQGRLKNNIDDYQPLKSAIASAVAAPVQRNVQTAPANVQEQAFTTNNQTNNNAQRYW